MFTIRSEQLTAFESARKIALVDSLLQEVKELHEELCVSMSDFHIVLLIEKALIRASEHGFEQESNLATFVHLMFGVAPSFYLHPRVKMILTDPHVPIEDRLDRLRVELSDHEWREIVEATNASAW
jgi:hypothetical protein